MRNTPKLLIKTLIAAGLFVGAASLGEAMEGPDVVELDALGNQYEAVTFDHIMHVDIVSCAACHHHTTGTPAEDEKCLKCHKEAGPDDAIACVDCHSAATADAVSMARSSEPGLYHIERTGIKRAYHLNCMGCHIEMDAASGCEDCHAKK